MKLTVREGIQCLFLIVALTMVCDTANAERLWSKRELNVLSEDCTTKVRVNLPAFVSLENGSRVDIKNARNNGPQKADGAGLINYYCVLSNAGSITDFVEWNPDAGEWAPKLNRILESKNSTSDSQWAHRWYRRNYHVIQLKSANASGYAILDKTSTGFGTIPGEEDKESQRSGPINLTFCLLHPPKAMCGDGLMGYRQNGPQGDVTDRALKILRSIEFID
ncbi:MAG: hypothetical protein J7605_19465 [Variovorax sp.]|nr:hypothetical protein [Variovorax sp.]